jgi:hypothetical protein
LPTVAFFVVLAMIVGVMRLVGGMGGGTDGAQARMINRRSPS